MPLAQHLAGPAGNKASGDSSVSYTERVKGRPAHPFAPEEPIVSEAVKEALKVVFSKEGTYAQELIVDELVSAVDAMSREALGEAVKVALSSATAVAALQSVEALGPLRSMLVPLPLTSLSAMAPTVKLTEDDKQALHTIRYVFDALLPSLANIPEAAVAGRSAVQVGITHNAPNVPRCTCGRVSSASVLHLRPFRGRRICILTTACPLVSPPDLLQSVLACA